MSVFSAGQNLTLTHWYRCRVRGCHDADDRAPADLEVGLEISMQYVALEALSIYKDKQAKGEFARSRQL